MAARLRLVRVPSPAPLRGRVRRLAAHRGDDQPAYSLCVRDAEGEPEAGDRRDDDCVREKAAEPDAGSDRHPAGGGGAVRNSSRVKRCDGSTKPAGQPQKAQRTQRKNQKQGSTFVSFVSFVLAA